QPINERNVPWYYDFPYFVPRKLLEGLATRLAASRGQEDESTRTEAQRYVETHPELEGLVPLLLDRSDGPGRELALLLAGYLGTPAVLQAARAFARGVRGSERLRAGAAELADTAGALHGDSLRRWVGGEWCGGSIGRFDIHTEPVARTHAPGVLELLTRG